jgi:hypothetical protein
MKKKDKNYRKVQVVGTHNIEQIVRNIKKSMRREAIATVGEFRVCSGPCGRIMSNQPASIVLPGGIEFVNGVGKLKGEPKYFCEDCSPSII